MKRKITKGKISGKSAKPFSANLAKEMFKAIEEYRSLQKVTVEFSYAGFDKTTVTITLGEKRGKFDIGTATASDLESAVSSALTDAKKTFALIDGKGIIKPPRMPK